jgi:putative ATP-binding cassette transporter
LAEWKASVNRLAGFHAAVDEARLQKSGITVAHNNVGAILLDALQLDLPGGQPLLNPVAAQIHAGQRILVAGPSGCGKSTLFRAIAGIWPYGSGTIEIPQQQKVLFLPQRSYLPIGALRTAIMYPAAENAYKDLAIQHYLGLCQLPHLVEKLDIADNWSQRLSPGEQQRLAFVRVLLARPDVLFLDEASSALDTDTEDALYQLLIEELPEAAIISIAHREGVAQYHQFRWQFVPDSAWLGPTEPGSRSIRYAIETTRLAKGAAKTAT